MRHKLRRGGGQSWPQWSALGSTVCVREWMGDGEQRHPETVACRRRRHDSRLRRGWVGTVWRRGIHRILARLGVAIAWRGERRPRGHGTLRASRLRDTQTKSVVRETYRRTPDASTVQKCKKRNYIAASAATHLLRRGTVVVSARRARRRLHRRAALRGKRGDG